MKGFQKLIPVDQALKTFLAAVPSKKPKTVSVTLTSALNRVLAENVMAKEDLPRFDRSAVEATLSKPETLLAPHSLSQRP